MKKTLCAFCAVVVAVVLLTSLFVFAGVENGEAVVVLDSVSGMPGQEVTMNMTLTRNPGITGLRFFVKYDASRLEIVSATYTKIGGGGLTSVNIKNNPFVVLWNVSTYEFTETGVLCTLVFKIKDGAEAGATPVSLSYGRGDCIDFDLKNLDMNITNGNVNVLYDGTNCEHTNTEARTVKESDCKNAGSFENVCKKCNSTVSSGALPLKEHSYGKLIVTKVPTCDEVGLKEQTCSVCGDVRTEPIDKLPRPEKDDTTVTDKNTQQVTDTSQSKDTDTDMIATEDVGSSSVTTLTDETVAPESSPATGDETVVFIIVAVLALVLIIFVIILKIRRNMR